MVNPKKKGAPATSSAAPTGNAQKMKKTESKKDLRDDTEASKSIDEHPLAIGHHLLVKYRDESERLAVIIERNRREGPDPSQCWQYYIHFLDFNRRMDEWINVSRIVSYPSDANFLEERRRAEATTDLASLGLDMDGKRLIRKRKINDDGNEEGPTTIDELEHDEHEGMSEEALKEHEDITKIKNVQHVLLGKHYIECWYFSPFPKELFADSPMLEYLYFCEFTLRFFVTKEELVRYQSRPNLPRHPPGNEIYRDANLSMFEIDGTSEKIYCQNLCYFAKLFLDHKTLNYDVDAFLFYVLCTYDDRGYHPVGYFSKEK
jgi:histone acetyltransferase MYST1